jgi:FMN phosphatase YigB (HAD superfamily)
MSKPAALAAWYGIGLAEMNRFRETHETPESHVRPSLGIEEALDIFGSRFRLVLATNNSPKLARRILRSLGIAEDRFVAVVAAEDAGAPKPAEAFFAYVVKAAGTSYDRSVSVGDGLVTDIEPARALGFATYHVRGPRDVVHAARVLRGMLR